MAYPSSHYYRDPNTGYSHLYSAIPATPYGSSNMVFSNSQGSNSSASPTTSHAPLPDPTRPYPSDPQYHNPAYGNSTSFASPPQSPKTSRRDSNASLPDSKPRNAFACLHPGCPSAAKGAKFTRATDLDRHYRTVHNTKEYLIDCPHRWCGRYGEDGFTRRDHFVEHLREIHREFIPKLVRRVSRA